MPERDDSGEPVSAPATAGGAPAAEAGGESIEEEVRKAATEYFDRLTDAAGRLSEQARQVYTMSHDYARAHPTGLIIGAFGLGVVLGMLFDSD